MGKAQALDRVGELDVDPEIVGVELQGVARREPGVLVHGQSEHRDAVTERELPMTVVRRIGLERDAGHAGPVPYPVARYQPSVCRQLGA